MEQDEGKDVLRTAAKARGATHSEANEDITRDWKLDSKRFDDKAVKTMLALTSQLAMSNSLWTKVCEAVCLFRVKIHQQVLLRTEAKARTSAFHAAIKDLPKSEKAKLLRPSSFAARRRSRCRATWQPKSCHQTTSTEWLYAHLRHRH